MLEIAVNVTANVHLTPCFKRNSLKTLDNVVSDVPLRKLEWNGKERKEVAKSVSWFVCFSPSQHINEIVRGD